jgi:hypothetical protein
MFLAEAQRRREARRKHLKGGCLGIPNSIFDNLLILTALSASLRLCEKFFWKGL